MKHINGIAALIIILILSSCHNGLNVIKLNCAVELEGKKYYKNRMVVDDTLGLVFKEILVNSNKILNYMQDRNYSKVIEVSQGARDMKNSSDSSIIEIVDSVASWYANESKYTQATELSSQFPIYQICKLSSCNISIVHKNLLNDSQLSEKVRFRYSIGSNAKGELEAQLVSFSIGTSGNQQKFLDLIKKSIKEGIGITPK